MIKYHKELIENKTPDELGITYPSYWNIMQGKDVTLKVLVRIIDALGITLREFIYYEDED